MEKHSGMEHARRVGLEIKALDFNQILAGTLFQYDAYTELADMLAQYGEIRVRSAANAAFGRDRAGNPMRRGHIRTWGYFIPAIEEARRHEEAATEKATS